MLAVAPASPVVVSLQRLQHGVDDETLEQAFGANSLGIIIVKDLQSKFLDLRQRVLASRASVLATLPSHELAELECEEATWLIGWSCGKEKVAKSGKADVYKGSFYINCAFHNDASLEGPRSDLVASYANHKAYTAPNLWPEEVAQLQGFKSECKELINLIIDVAELVAGNCDRYISKLYADYETGYLKSMIKQSTCTKARLLHYFPAQDGCGNNDDAEDDDWCGEHVDHSCLTGLTSAVFLDESRGITHALDGSPDPEAGLYIRNRNDEVVKVNIPHDCLAFQSGSALQEISKGKFRAVPHFVKGTSMPRIARNTLAVGS
ncbi:uncharacterized protein LODBEIA_P19530 [Lodderomyces beijingensis]|uniref:Isopenicillin N synthase-like Fe(2+) 2OG dioxygenase domain-containing protein n=1 Tax=Lodderomyces beijingensis TaxID=1775926 RepID=A0ABP0ZIN0_9ASCO